MKKLLIYSYRIALVLYLFIRGFQLLEKAFHWFLYLYPPYTGFAPLVLVAAFSLYLFVMERRIGKSNQISNHAVLSNDEQPPTFYRETEEIVEGYLSRCPFEWERYDGSYTIRMSDHERCIYIDTENLLISAEVLFSGCNNRYYRAETLEKLQQEFSKDMDAILGDRLVQVSFVIDESTLRDSFLCPPENADNLIREKCPVYTKKPPLWSRFLRLLFLVPQKKPITKICIASASGKYDKSIPL